jgi:hypothetical protein
MIGSYQCAEQAVVDSRSWVICKTGNSKKVYGFAPYRVELQISGLTGTASLPDMQKIRIIGFFFANWQFEVEKKHSTNGCFRLRIYLRTNTTYT